MNINFIQGTAVQSMKLLIIFLLNFFQPALAEPFSISERFFDRNAFIEGKSKKEFMPSHCPDGSRLIALDIETDLNKPKIDSATCLYHGDEVALIVEHVWNGDKKIEEYIEIDHVRNGPATYKVGEKAYFVHRYCNGKIFRTEIIGENDSVVGITFDLSPEVTNDEPDIIVIFDKPETSYGLERLTEVDESTCSKFKTKSPTFNALVNRDWYAVSNIKYKSNERNP